MSKAIAHVPTRQGAKYIQQLCKHWSHKLAVEWEPGRGVVRFPAAVAMMAAEPDALVATIEAEDAATLETMQQVLASHLDRFAFREAPLAFEWKAAA